MGKDPGFGHEVQSMQGETKLSHGGEANTLIGERVGSSRRFRLSKGGRNNWTWAGGVGGCWGGLKETFWARPQISMEEGGGGGGHRCQPGAERK